MVGRQQLLQQMFIIDMVLQICLYRLDGPKEAEKEDGVPSAERSETI